MKFIGGLPETACGGGSTLAATEHLRGRLPATLRYLRVRSLLDAPCGDFNWMSRVNLGDITYVGADYSAQNLIAASNRSSSQVFHQLDIITDALPQADAMLCRDFHQHLPTEMAVAALRNFIASGTRWLLATSHSNEVNTDIAEAGDFRPINLMRAPFNFPKPVAAIDDPPGSGRILGAWSREVIIHSMK